MAVAAMIFVAGVASASFENLSVIIKIYRLPEFSSETEITFERDKI